MDRIKRAAVEYRRLTGKPLGITGEVAEQTAAKLLKLDLMPPRWPGYDAEDSTGKRVQIKGTTHEGTLGAVHRDKQWDSVLWVKLDLEYEVVEIWECDRSTIEAELDRSPSKTHDRGVVGVAWFRHRGQRRWCRLDHGVHPDAPVVLQPCVSQRDGR